ncbi:uncharacterized protein LOC134686457 isoform X1 [Mytilus trossulus]|uniref:uncharacterized protein LOC134686457 isoform X1 n=1 Tax=Mytilus trossulus TaxID=6551 RepID=UPI003007D500
MVNYFQFNFTMKNVREYSIYAAVILSVIGQTASLSNFSMSCGPGVDDPNSCTQTSRTQKCYRYNGETKCEVTTFACQSMCCPGWEVGMKGKCDTPIKNFQCSESLINSTKRHGSEYCVDNTYCNQGEVCCSNYCTRIQLSKHHCWYRNVYRTVGETNTTSNDVCTVCSCNTDGHISTMECEKSTCNWDNQTDIPKYYKPPVIYNIPKKGQMVSVYVLSTSNSAYLDTNFIYALDFEGNMMKVYVSKNTFKHCLCTNSTESVIAKSVPDKFGNYNETTFLVNIIDRFEPVFHNCPQNRVIQSNDMFGWTAPTVTDNVGVQEIDGPVLPQRNTTTLVPGTYTMVYKAKDWSKNTATCRFTITVQDPPDVNPKPAHEHKISVTLLIIIGGSLAALVVIALVAFYVSSMCRIVKTYSVNEKKKIPSNEHGHIYGSVNDNGKL